MMKKILTGVVLFLLLTGFARAQFRQMSDDSLISLLKGRYSAPSFLRNSAGLEWLGRQIPGKGGFDSLQDLLVSETESSRDRSEMCRVNLGIARVYLGYQLAYDYAVKSKPFLERGAGVADESGLDLYKADALILRGRLAVISAQLQKALDFDNQAVALAISTGNDSLIALAYSWMSITQDFLGNKLSRLQALLSARNYADKSGLTDIMLPTQNDLGKFYRDVDQMEKSRDYFSGVIKAGRAAGAWDHVIEAYRGMGVTYRIKHDRILAVAAYDSALAIAERFSLKQYKVNVTIDLLNYYFNEETPDRGLAYLAANPELNRFISDIGIAYQINKVYAMKYEISRNYDSALWYLNQSASAELDQPQAFHEKYEFSSQWARVLKKSGRQAESLKHFLAAASYADSAGDLDLKRDVSENLDSAYQATGDFKNAFHYYSRYNYYKDSLDMLGRQKDLMNAEIEDAGKRAEQEKILTEEKLRRRDNLEYMGITAAIALLFIILMILGVFRMSVSVIKALGFFSFIFLFEFITLLLDYQIHELTHGEPWKVLAIKIVLIAMLLPLHHYLEHKAIVFLTSKAHLLRKNFRGSGPAGSAPAETGH